MEISNILKNLDNENLQNIGKLLWDSNIESGEKTAELFIMKYGENNHGSLGN